MGSQYAGSAASFPADFTIPDDGDDIDAASVNVALEALGDRTANLKARNPYYLLKTHVATQEPASDVAPTVIRAWTGTSFGTYEELLSLTGGDVPAVNDIVEVSITCNLIMSKAAHSVTTFGAIRPFVQENGSAWLSIPGSVYSGLCALSGSGLSSIRSSFHFRKTIATATNFKVSLNGRVSAVTDTPNVELDSGWTCIAKVWRPA